MDTTYKTRFAITANAGSLEWAGSKKGFVPTEVPHKGLRYKSQAGALGAYNNLIAELEEFPVEFKNRWGDVWGLGVIETYL